MTESAAALAIPLIPAALALPVAAGLGALIGSFMTVVVQRVPQGMSVVRSCSRCPQCAHRIAWFDSLPVLSYFALRGRCRHCGAPISSRYPLIEALTAVVFVLVIWAAYRGTQPAILTPLLLYWAATAVALGFIDLEHHRLPNVIVLPAYVVSAVMLVIASIVTGEYGRLASAAIGMLALGGFYFALATLQSGGMGSGDVKLAGALGMILGWLGWAQLVVGGFAAFLLGGAFAVALMVSGRANRKTALPFGPFMMLGAAVGVYADPASVLL
ncbi:A24 family peptidase [Microbacterium sp.]|uniref:prepilin peptidase n=1 Tax=Microbacterium sp. TaxID=51671 RepID=UPI0025D7E273|nr:A24 family peptidase [Microbacterium sp.]